jgi:hypothetical protein
MCFILFPGLSVYVICQQKNHRSQCPPTLLQLPMPIHNNSKTQTIKPHQTANPIITYLTRTLLHWPESMQLNRIHIDAKVMTIEAQCSACHWRAIHQIQKWLHHTEIHRLHRNNSMNRYEIDYITALPTA